MKNICKQYDPCVTCLPVYNGRTIRDSSVLPVNYDRKMYNYNCFLVTNDALININVFYYLNGINIRQIYTLAAHLKT